MARLAISARQLDAVERHAVEEQPEECCGILVGEPAGKGGFLRVRRVVAAENARRDRPGDRYSINPRALLAVHREARAEGLEVVGYYHSHLGGKASPSAVDRRAAWPAVSYLIVSLDRDKVVERRSWRLSDDYGVFEEEELVVVMEERRPAAGA